MYVKKISRLALHKFIYEPCHSLMNNEYFRSVKYHQTQGISTDLCWLDKSSFKKILYLANKFPKRILNYKIQQQKLFVDFFFHFLDLSFYFKYYIVAVIQS